MTYEWDPIRLDADVLKRLKAYGTGYQTRINHILRAVTESQPHVRHNDQGLTAHARKGAAHSDAE
jgi:hypothetical protein